MTQLQAGLRLYLVSSEHFPYSWVKCSEVNNNLRGIVSIALIKNWVQNGKGNQNSLWSGLLVLLTSNCILGTSIKPRPFMLLKTRNIFSDASNARNSLLSACPINSAVHCNHQVGAKAPDMSLLGWEEDGNKVPCLAERQAGLALQPTPAIVRLWNGAWSGVGAERTAHGGRKTLERADRLLLCTWAGGHWLGLQLVHCPDGEPFIYILVWSWEVVRILENVSTLVAREKWAWKSLLILADVKRGGTASWNSCQCISQDQTRHDVNLVMKGQVSLYGTKAAVRRGQSGSGPQYVGRYVVCELFPSVVFLLKISPGTTICCQNCYFSCNRELSAGK